MSRMKYAAALILAVAFVVEARAGGPPPTFIVVDKLVFEPNEQAPERIQIWGSFSFLKEKTGYSAPVQGYLYYTLANGKEEQCRREWATLQKLVADKHMVALGFCGSPKVDGHLRKPDEKPHSPVAFPVTEQGFTEGESWVNSNPSLRKLEKLAAAQKTRTEAKRTKSS
jgi:hypothetical protein